MSLPAKRLVLLSLALYATAAEAQAAQSTQRITTNFKDADITTVVEAVANATGKNFILDPRVRAQVNLISASPMTPNEFYQAFLSILQVNQFAAVETGNIVKIVPDANVRTVPGNDLPSRLDGGSDEMVTHVISAKNVSASQLSAVLRPLIAPYGNLAPVPGTNTLIITDRASNVNRIMRIINRVDQVGDANIEVIPLQNSTAADVVRTMTALTAGQGAQDAAGLAPRVVADDRSNSVLVSGDTSQRLRLKTLIAHLDTPMDNGGDTQVRYLRYADAEKIAPKLKEQLTGIAAATGGAGAAGAAAGADRSTMIWAEPETNALVITAPPKTMRSIMTIVDRLDIRRAQVHVEAIIAEVDDTDIANLGVNWAVFSNENGSRVPIGSFVSPVAGTDIVDLAGAVLARSPTNIPDLNGTTFGIGRLRDAGVNWGAMIRALRTDRKNNVIATPSVTTMDNQEAEMKSAQEVPFITGQYTNTGGNNNGNVNPFTTVQRQEVGTILKVTPQINGGDAMILKIELESSGLAGTAGDAGSLITNKRTMKTHVLIEDGGTIVLGGLLVDSKDSSESRVPFLGRIPLLGEAFRTRAGNRSRSNLMVFIRPRILSDETQTTLETNSKYNLMRDAQLRQRTRGELIPLLPGDKAPLLPAAPEVPASSTTSPAVKTSETEAAKNKAAADSPPTGADPAAPVPARPAPATTN